MKTTIQFINDLAGLRVLDIGGTGYDDKTTLRERRMRAAWSKTTRTVMDLKPTADLGR